MEELDFERDLQIDPDALDVEWLEQPGLYMRYCRASAQAQRKFKHAEQNVKVVRSQLIKEAEETLDGKPSAQKIEAYYRDHPRHKEAKEAAIQAEYEANLLQNAVFAFNQRKTSLEELVRLHGMSYFAGPTEPRNLSEATKEALATGRETARSATQDRIHDRLNRRKRQEEDEPEPEERPRRTRRTQ